jgi:hypothetical protein
MFSHGIIHDVEGPNLLQDGLGLPFRPAGHPTQNNRSWGLKSTCLPFSPRERNGLKKAVPWLLLLGPYPLKLVQPKMEFFGLFGVIMGRVRFSAEQIIWKLRKTTIVRAWI